MIGATNYERNNMEAISLERANLVGDEGAVLALKNIGTETTHISWYSVNGRPEQGRSSPVTIRPREVENLTITIHGQGYKFEKGKEYEFRVKTHKQNEFIFKIVL
jgi:hypothetical protein